jgi:hypothetical protein
VGPEPLELALGVEVAVPPVEREDQAHSHAPIAHAVQEPAAEPVPRGRVAERVDRPVRAERVVAREATTALIPRA